VNATIICLICRRKRKGMIEISRYTSNEAQGWDDFVRQSKNATFLFLRQYMDYHSDRFDDYSLIARHDGKIVAVLPANRDGDTLKSHGGLTYGGWLMPLKHFDVTVMMEVTDAAVAFLKAQGIEEIIYKAVPHIYHSYAAEEDLYAIFRHGATLIESNISTAIPLDKPLAFDRGNKSGLNIALKEGVKVAESDDFAAYWKILDTLLESRYDTQPVHSLEEIELLHSRFPKNIRLTVATIDGEIVAGVVLFVTQQVAHCQYIAASPEGKAKKALTAVFDHIIKEATAKGLKWVDFGTSNEDHGRILNEGLVQQKARLGGRGIVYNTYKITL
jgi:hypothetical protein